MENSRRHFLKIAGISALGIGTSGICNSTSAKSEAESPVSSFEKNSKGLKAKHWGMVIDTRKLKTAKDIEIITKACHLSHNVPDFKALPEKEQERHEIKWIWGEDYKHAFTSKTNAYLNEQLKNSPILVLCNHCENPPCVQACPTKATFKRDDGIVMMDYHRCIGCRFCMAACPYGSRSFNFRDPRDFIPIVNKAFPTRMKGVVEKCNFCAERLAVGKKPSCVEASNGAITFGDLSDPNSEVRKLLKANYSIRRKPELGTNPSVYYIV